MLVNSAFSFSFFWDASFALRGLPRSGNTPYMFRSSLERPDTMPPFAESPSQRISVHCADLAPPAQLASVSFGRPLIVLVLRPSVFLAVLLSLISVRLTAASITPSLPTPSTNLALTAAREPNLGIGVLRYAFPWLSNDGFSITQFMKIISCSLIVAGLTLIFFFFSMSAPTPRTICPSTWSTCRPPLAVQIPLTNET